jgi:hypothetical protein
MTPCWLWVGAKTRDGYGRFAFRGKDMLAHRMSFLLHFGAVDDVEAVMHTCDVRSCVNPHHLRHGTRADNAGAADEWVTEQLDARAGGRG